MLRSAKTDTNQKQIVAAMRQIGAAVVLTHQIKNAFDCIAFYRGKTFVIEIKNPVSLPKEYDRDRLEKSLSEGEQKCMELIQSKGVNYHIIATVDEALKMLQT